VPVRSIKREVCVELLSRQAVEADERRRLSEHAAFSDATRGRERPLEPDPWRTEFQRDRDRIIHCKAFRRLAHKTQVFLAPKGDHYRTRLTHTLEVSQIARSIARTLRLNEDLAEAVALGHDLGHTPFGHIGEDALTSALAEISARYPGTPASFDHNLQSLRIVEQLEYEGKGLNLTWEVRDGIVHHTGSQRPATLEGQIVAVADRIAYINHDIDDAIRGGVLAEEDLPKGPTDVLGHHHGVRITTLVQDMVSASEGADEIRLSQPVWDAMMELREFLFDNVYLHSDAKSEDPKALRLVQALFRHFMEHPESLPDGARADDPELPRLVTDYIAGMTDRFAISTYEELFVPGTWSEL
jgi:dGTPase